MAADTDSYIPYDPALGAGYPGYIPANIPVNSKRGYGEQLDFIQELLSKDELLKQVPDELKLYVTGFVKNLAISNFTEKDVTQMVNAFDDMKTAYLMRQPPGAYTWDIEYTFTVLRPVIYAEACRAKDGQERKLMATSINQTYMQSDMRGQPMGGNSGGLFGRLRKIFGRY